MISDIEHGLYKIYWMDGGYSLAAVGSTYDGTRWYAPTNWTTDSNNNPLVASTNWDDVERIEGPIDFLETRTASQDVQAALDDASEHLKWLKDTKEDHLDIARIVGFEDCLNLWRKALEGVK